MFVETRREQLSNLSTVITTHKSSVSIEFLKSQFLLIKMKDIHMFIYTAFSYLPFVSVNFEHKDKLARTHFYSIFQCEQMIGQNDKNLMGVG